MSILSSDDSQRGAKDGSTHAKAGKDKNLRGMGNSLKFAVWGNDAADSYAKAYYKAYDGELAKKYDIYYDNSSNKGFGTGSGPSNSGGVMYTGQNIHALADTNAIADFHAELSQFKRDLVDKTNDLKNFIMSMQSNSWDDENYIEFRQLFSNITHKVTGIEGSILEQSMLPVLQNYIEKIRQAQMKG